MEELNKTDNGLDYCEECQKETNKRFVIKCDCKCYHYYCKECKDKFLKQDKKEKKL